jgi:hypothetical protein
MTNATMYSSERRCMFDSKLPLDKSSLRPLASIRFPATLMSGHRTTIHNTAMDGFPRGDIVMAKHLKDMIICE